MDLKKPQLGKVEAFIYFFDWFCNTLPVESRCLRPGTFRKTSLQRSGLQCVVRTDFNASPVDFVVLRRGPGE